MVFHLYNHEFPSLGSFVQNLVELVLEKRISECCPSSLAKGDGMFQQNLAQRIVGEEKKNGRYKGNSENLLTIFKILILLLNSLALIEKKNSLALIEKNEINRVLS